MRRAKLGNSDIEVSVIALGCWPFGGKIAWGDQDDADSIATVHAALDAGINFFDTAEAYDAGKSEEVLGTALRGRRHEAVIATKLGGAKLAPEAIPAACERSLRDLQTDFIDLYQIHWPNHDVPLAETIGGLQRLQEQGKIRSFGVSNFGPQDLGEAVSLGRIATNQINFSLFWRVCENEIQPLCLEHGVGILCYSSLAQGLLTGRYANIDEVPNYLKRTRWYDRAHPDTHHDEPGCESEIFAALPALRDLANSLNTTMACLAMAWLLQQGGVTSILVGARKPDEVGWNLPALELTLDDATLQQLARITQPVKTRLGNNADMWFTESRMR